MNLDQALEGLHAAAEPGRDVQAAAYHKIDRPYLGVPNPVINDLTKAWRKEMSVEERVALAGALWQTDIYEARLAAAKLLTQARIRGDEGVWELIKSWVADFDSWAIADHACMAGMKRLVADPARIDEIEDWHQSEHMWTRRAAFVITLPWTKQNHPKPQELAVRTRVLGWAEALVSDHDWFIQKAIAWWLRDLSKHDRARVAAFLEAHGAAMKPWAVREARRHMDAA
ncbi:MAG: DNA alkylation repair protein [Paracoccaceae bacterium]